MQKDFGFLFACKRPPVVVVVDNATDIYICICARETACCRKSRRYNFCFVKRKPLRRLHANYKIQILPYNFLARIDTLKANRKQSWSHEENTIIPLRLLSQLDMYCFIEDILVIDPDFAAGFGLGLGKRYQ